MYDRVLIPDSAKASVPSPVYLSRFVGRNGLTSKSVMVADSRTVVVKGFTFRGLAPGRCLANPYNSRKFGCEFMCPSALVWSIFDCSPNGLLPQATFIGEK